MSKVWFTRVEGPPGSPWSWNRTGFGSTVGRNDQWGVLKRPLHRIRVLVQDWTQLWGKEGERVTGWYPLQKRRALNEGTSVLPLLSPTKNTNTRKLCYALFTGCYASDDPLPPT